MNGGSQNFGMGGMQNPTIPRMVPNTTPLLPSTTPINNNPPVRAQPAAQNVDVIEIDSPTCSPKAGQASAKKKNFSEMTTGTPNTENGTQSPKTNPLGLTSDLHKISYQ
jgi:hypothetical protein